jgi:hypothetical protein
MKPVDTMRLSIRATGAADTTMLAQLRNMITRRDSILRLNSSWVVPSAVANGQVFYGGLLTSGIAPMMKTIDSFFLGELKDYNVIVSMTKVTGWK